MGTDIQGIRDFLVAQRGRVHDLEFAIDRAVAHAVEAREALTIDDESAREARMLVGQALDLMRQARYGEFGDFERRALELDGRLQNGGG